MADEVVGSAFVEIKPKLDEFDRTLKRDAKGRFISLERAAESAGESIEGSMREASKQSDSWLDKIGGADVWEKLKEQASRAGEAITGHFREAARQSDRALDGVSTGRGAIGFGALATGIGSALATLGAGAGLKFAVDQASSLGESVNAVNVVLGDAAAGFLGFGESAAQNLGLTQNALNEAVTPLAALLKNAGLEGDQLSLALAGLAQSATDTGSVLNKDTGEVLLAFGAALRGEAEPARALGVSFNDAAVQAKAMELGLVGANGEVDEAAKTQARLALVMEQTKTFAGDFQNTADSLPNTMKRLKASATEAAAGFGTALLPAIADVAGGINDMIVAMGPSLEKFGQAIGENLQPVFDALGPAIADLLPILTTIVDSMGTVFAGIAPLIQPVVGIIGILVDALSSGLSVAMEALAPIITTISNAIVEFGPVLEDALVAGLTALEPVLLSVSDALNNGLGDIIPILAGAFADLAPIIAEIAGLLGGAIAEVLPVLAEAFTAILTAVRPLLPIIAGLIRNGLKILVPIITSIVEAAAPLIADVFEALGPIIRKLAPLIQDVLGKALPPIAEAFLSILGALEPLIPLLADTLLSILDALAPVLPTLAVALGSLAESFARILVALIPLLEPLLQLVALIVEKGLAPAIGLIAEALAGLAEILASIVEVVAGFVEDVIGWFQSLYDTLVGHSIIPDLIKGIIEWFQKLPIELVRIAAELVEKLVGKMIELAESMLGKAQDLVSNVVGAFTGLATDVYDAVSGLVSDVLGFFTDLPGDIVDLLADLGSLIGGAFDDAVDGVTTAATSLIDTVLGFFGELPGKILNTLGDVGSDIADGLLGAFKDAWNTLVDTVPEVGVSVFGKSFKFDPSDYLKLANGAILNSPTFFMGGEAGREVVVPLTRPQRALDLADASGLTDMILAARAGSGGLSVAFNGGQVFQDATDADVVAQRVYAAAMMAA